MERVRHPQKLAARLGDPDEVELSFIALFDGWPADVERFHRSAAEHLAGSWQLIVVDNPGDEEGSERIAMLDRTVHVPLRDKVGYGAGRNIGIKLATGRIVCVIDTSVEIVGDITIEPADAGVGLVGKWGVVLEGDHHFIPSDGPDVDGIEGYFIAANRSNLPRIGLFDPKFRFYRNADIDFSFQARDAGLRTIVDPSIPLERHVHRLWENTDDRDELSRRNFGRFRQHWGDRLDLITSR